MRMFALASSMVDQVWDDFAHHLERFERTTGETTAEHIKQEALAARMQIWGLQDADEVHGVVVTEVIDTAQGLVCVIRSACGSVPRGLQERLLDEIGHWARETGCAKVRIIGRRGWLRRFPRFRQTAVVGEWDLKAH